jgi:Ulp1 family protease
VELSSDDDFNTDFGRSFRKSSLKYLGKGVWANDDVIDIGLAYVSLSLDTAAINTCTYRWRQHYMKKKQANLNCHCLSPFFYTKLVLT